MSPAERRTVSFFDEDDEPTRRAPRPRRTAPAGGAAADPQTLWTRRAVAAGVGLLLIIFLAVVINACQDSRRKNALRNYNREAGQIITQSDGEVGAPFFEALGQGASQSPEDLQTTDLVPARDGGHEPQAGQGPLRPRRPHGRAGVAADRARAAPRRPPVRLGADLHRAGQRGRRRRPGAHADRRPDAVLPRLRRPDPHAGDDADRDHPQGQRRRRAGRVDQELPARLLVAAARLRGRQARHAPLRRQQHGLAATRTTARSPRACTATASSPPRSAA